MVGVTLLVLGGMLSDGWPTVDFLVGPGLWCIALGFTYLVDRAWNYAPWTKS